VVRCQAKLSPLVVAQLRKKSTSEIWRLGQSAAEYHDETGINISFDGLPEMSNFYCHPGTDLACLARKA
jgi:hypothetical protein